MLFTDAGVVDHDVGRAELGGAVDDGFGHGVSRGLPRAINNLALQALVAAYSAKKAIVDESSARAAVTEITAD
jgi:hypothetical protein